MIIRYVEVVATNNKNESKNEGIANKLEKIINRIESEANKRFIFACFLGQVDVPVPGEGNEKLFVVSHEILQKYMLFFR